MSNFTIEGFAGTEPRFTTTDKGLSIASFRVAVNHRKYDTSVNQWVATDTSWYTVTAFGVLAEQVQKSVAKGNAVIVAGELKIRNWESNGRSGSNAEIVATGIGLNLLFGDTQKVSSAPSSITAEAALFEADDNAALVGSPRPADAEWTEENIPF